MISAVPLAALSALVLKFVLFPATMLVLWLRPRARPRAAVTASRAFTRFANRRWLAVTTVGLAAATISMTLSLLRPVTPHFHDEYSYLLAADTYAHGRLTNPPHPLARHFETFQVLQRPTYASIYPPVQGLMLALGQATVGWPIAGVWLLQGLAAASVCWMLQGWVTPRWALLGGLIVVLHSGIQLTWGQSFWGGSHAMFGATLAYGALPRLLRRPTIGVSAALGFGVSVLANCRPYEGLTASLPVAVVLGWHTIGLLRRGRFADVARIALPAGGVITLAAAAMLHYFAAVTHDPLVMPYALGFRTYYASSMFLGRAPPPQPEYPHEDLRRYFLGWSLETIAAESYWPGFAMRKGARLAELAWFFLSCYLVIPALAVVGLWRRRDVRFACIALLFFFAAELQVPHWQTHYLAPAAPAALLLLVQGFRSLNAWRRTAHEHGGRLSAYAVMVPLALDFACLAFAHAATPHRDFSHTRLELVERLQRAAPGKHVVIVRYGPQHSVHEEWVYNAADVDAAPVVWARDYGIENDALLKYYADRRAWLLEIGDGPPKLQAYRPSPQSRSTAQN